MNKALRAIKYRDPVALEAAFDSVEDAEAFRNEWLPTLTPEDCRWFWSEVMTAEQLERTLDAVRDVCLSVAKEMDLEPGVHYSLGSADGQPTLVCREDVARVFYARLPRSRHSVLRFYLQVAV